MAGELLAEGISPGSSEKRRLGCGRSVVSSGRKETRRGVLFVRVAGWPSGGVLKLLSFSAEADGMGKEAQERFALGSAL